MKEMSILFYKCHLKNIVPKISFYLSILTFLQTFQGKNFFSKLSRVIFLSFRILSRFFCEKKRFQSKMVKINIILFFICHVTDQIKPLYLLMRSYFFKLLSSQNVELPVNLSIILTWARFSESFEDASRIGCKISFLHPHFI